MLIRAQVQVYSLTSYNTYTVIHEKEGRVIQTRVRRSFYRDRYWADLKMSYHRCLRQLLGFYIIKKNNVTTNQTGNTQRFIKKIQKKPKLTYLTAQASVTGPLIKFVIKFFI